MDWTDSARAVLDSLAKEKHELQRRNNLAEDTIREMELNNAELSRWMNELSEEDRQRVARKVRELSPKEMASVGDDFTASVARTQKGMREAAARRKAAVSVRTRTVKNEARGRPEPNSDSGTIVKMAPGTVLEIAGWASGQRLSGNDFWFFVNEVTISGRTFKNFWVWSGLFDAISNHGIPKIDYLRHVRDVQTELGVTADGIQGPNTLDAMRKHNYFGYALEAAFMPVISKPKRFVRTPEEAKPLDAFPANSYAETEKRDQEKERERYAFKNSKTHEIQLLRRTLSAEEVPDIFQPGDTIVVAGRRWTEEEVERTIQANLAYHLVPAWVGYYVVADHAFRGKWEIWRPTKELANRAGHDFLEKQVQRRRRAYDIRHPKLITARDRWIVEPTQAEQTAKERAEWDAEFNSAEEGKK